MDNTWQKIVGAFAYNDVAVSLDGGTTATDTNVVLPTTSLKYLILGNGATRATSNELSGYLRKIALYPARLPNATLQAMTEV